MRNMESEHKLIGIEFREHMVDSGSALYMPHIMDILVQYYSASGIH